MSGMETGNSAALIRANLWSNELKEVLQDELMAQSYVRWLSDFPDGNTLNIPSIGDLDASDYVENTAAVYSPLDTGNFQFTINNYLQSGTYITNRDKQDSYVADQLIASFVPKQARAIQVRLERDILKEGQPRTGTPAGYQVAGSTNAINGVAHRFVGSATVNAKQTLSVSDFARARASLKKANVPDTNLVAIIDPSVEFVMNTQTNLVNFSNNPRWEGIVNEGVATGMKFLYNIFGFDVYTSNYLADSGVDQSGASETISSVASGAGAKCNLFFSAASDVTPFVGAWRQMPKVDGEYNKDFQREEYITTARYGVKIYRPENLVTVLSDPTVLG